MTMPRLCSRVIREPRRALRKSALVAASLLAMASAPVLAVKPFTADYQVYFQGSPQGEGRMTLAQNGGNRWTYSLNIKGTAGMAAVAGADIAQTTVFEDNGGQWRPLSGSMSSKMLFKKSTKHATYDWSKGVATWSGDVKAEKAGPVRLKAGDLNGMLVNLALARDVAADRPLDYRLVDEGRAKQLRYEIAGKEKVEIGGKSQQATKVVRTDGDKQTIAWLVDGLPVPARILQRKNGRDEMDLRIRSVR